MRIFENISLAFSSLWANKMRSLLTMLGIIIGIGSVIAILTVGDALTGSVSESMAGLGANNITLSLQSKQDEGTSSIMGISSGIADKNLITEEMLADLRASYPDEIAGISISDTIGSGQTTAGRLYANLTLTGVNEDYANVNSLTIIQGRFLNERDSIGGKKVAIVSDRLVENMFGNEDPLGRQITITAGGHTGVYTIVGVYEYTASTMMMGQTASEKDVSTSVYIPLTTANKVTRNAGYSSVTVITTAATNSTEFAQTITRFFDKYYSRNEDFGVTATSMESIMDTVTEMMDSIQIAIAAIAAISLLVGGIGVMNIMMVSITERTREIGTRKAIGATNGEIRVQFVVEAVIICMVGGVIGIALGAALGSLGAGLLGVGATPSLSNIALATGFSICIGVFFGYYPANKAAQLNPIDALRYE
ncbi:ABC transporter permease [Ruminococcaceae bacterium OttesenSCG-928-N02]|nr:ABC transporter permease [Ruminococcaceae bacterium OttesenSCG-928-N02]